MTTNFDYYKQLKDYENKRDNDPDLKEKKLQIEKLVNELNILKDSYDRKNVEIMARLKQKIKQIFFFTWKKNYLFFKILK